MQRILYFLGAHRLVTVASVLVCMAAAIGGGVFYAKNQHPQAGNANTEQQTTFGNSPNAAKNNSTTSTTPKPTDTAKKAPSTPTANTDKAKTSAGNSTTPAGTTGGTTGGGSSGSTAPVVSCSGTAHIPGGPDSWGGCWPGPNNTGVPSGTTLTAYTGPCTITANNTVITAKTISCDLVIQAANVTITKSRFTNGSVSTDENSTGYSFSISDSEVNIGNRAGTGIGAVNFTATRVEVTGGNRSMHCWNNCTITDSYVHGQFTDPSGTFHESGIRMGQSLTLRHNTVACDAPDVPPDGGCSAGLTGYGDFGPVQNNTIDKNLFVATTGGYCTYGGSSAGKPYSSQANHVVFTNNIWQRGTNLNDHGGYTCGYYGSNTAFNPAAPGNIWSGNKYDDGSTVASSN